MIPDRGGPETPFYSASKSSGSQTGLGIVSSPSANTARTRSYTLDSFNISPIESKSARQKNLPGEDASSSNWERATWEFSDILQSFSVKDKDDMRAIISKSNQLAALLIEYPSLKNEIVIENVLIKVQFMLYDSRSQVRAAAYRILRHACANVDSLLVLVHSKILIFLIISFSTPTPLLEKEHALKLVRQFTTIPGGLNYLSVGIVKALVAFVENENDEDRLSEASPMTSDETYTFVRMCIQTISEIAVLKPEIVFHGGGIRLLIYLTINGSIDIATSCMLTILTILDIPHARLFFRNGADLDSLTSVFNLFEDDDSRKSLNTKKYYNKALKTSFFFSCFFKNWSGLICLSHGGFNSIKVLLSNLKKRNNKLCSILLDLLLDILLIKQMPWLEDSAMGDLISQTLTHFTPTNKHARFPNFENIRLSPGSFEYTVISHYQGLVTKILIDCEVVPLLFNVVNEDRNPENTSKATALLSDLFDFCSRLLPSELYDKHILLAYTSNLTLTSMSKIEEATKKRRQGKLSFTTNSEIRNMVRNLTLKTRMEMDDNTFRSLVIRAKLTTPKDFDEWNWSSLSQLFQGPLHNQKKFLELQEKNPKFLKTFFAFLRPFKYCFSAVPLSASSRHPKIRKPKNMILIACQLFEALLAYDDGCKYISTNKLMPQIAEIFAQVDPYSGISSKDPILSQRRMEHTLSSGYVKLVGVLSSTSGGVGVLEKWQLFQIMHNIIGGSMDDESNNFLIFTLLKSLSYSNRGPTQVLLAKALSVSNWKIKLYVLENIFPSLSLNKECETFYIQNLVTLLYDENESVAKMSVEYMYDYFVTQENISNIDKLVEHRPSIPILEQSTEGHALLLNFLTTPSGFKYLNRHGYVERVFNETINDLRSLNYLTAIENSLRSYFLPFPSPATAGNDGISRNLRHFFHYLLATDDGFNFFNNRRGYIDESVSQIRSLCRTLGILERPLDSPDLYAPKEQESLSSTQQAVLYGKDSPISIVKRERVKTLGLYSSSTENFDSVFEVSPSENIPQGMLQYDFVDNEYLLKRLKQYIWVIGEVASAKYGIQILEPIYSPNINNEHIAETLSQIFQNATNWQLRGLAFYQLGKMAATVEGVEILDELEWISFDSREPLKISLAYPKFMQKDGFTKVEVLNPYRDVSYYTLFGNAGDIQLADNLDLEDEVVIQNYEKIDEQILGLFNYLSSVLGRIERKASKELSRIKRENPEVFENVTLFSKTIRLIDKGKFKYRVRVFIFSLFDTRKIMEGLLKKNRKSSTIKR